jgi:TolB-like protein/Tfp pilus assembly protein PilF
MPESGGSANEHNQEAADGPPNSREVFISYASQDAAVANAVVIALESNGLKCWIAPRDVTPGILYAGAIVHAIDAAKAIVLILSQNAAASPHVVREVERAASKRHPVLSLRIDRASLPADLEYFLNTSQWLDASDGDMRRALPQLVAAIRLAIGTPTSPTVESYATSGTETRSRAAHPVARTRSVRWTAIVAGSLLAVAIVGIAVDRIWLSSRRIATPEPTLPASTAAIPPTAIPEKSVAVLPFLDMSEKKDQEYFSDGMSEELIDMLTKIPDLHVPARTSSFYFKGKSATIADIAKALSVLYVLEGSVRKAGKTLRVTAQLIRANNGYHVWSETYDRQLDDVFKVQDEIAGAVVKALKISLMGEPLPDTAGTENVEAYNLYLQATAMHHHAKERSDHENVVSYLRKALTLDPEFANAWAVLSNALSTLAEYGYVPAKQIGDEPRRAAEQAIKLNPKLSDAHAALARIFIVYDWDVTRGEVQLRQALALDPNNQWALSWAATLAARRGQFDQAIELIQRSIVSDPVNPFRYSDLADILYDAKRFDEALVANRRSLDLNPGLREAQTLPVAVSLATGSPAAALAVIENDKELRETCACRAFAYDELGRGTDADRVLEDLEKNHPDADPYGIAQVYANRGKLDLAFKWFDKAYQNRNNDLMEAKVDPLLKNVQSDPRFNELLKKLGLQN